MIDYTVHIKTVTPWVLLKEIPTGKGPIVKAMKEKYNTEGHGVYQLIEAKDVTVIDDKTFVHPDIGYTGVSSNVFSRVGGIKTASHGAGKLVHQVSKDPLNEFWIRYLFTEPGQEDLVEKSIQRETINKYNYMFKWRGASAGLDGSYTRIMSELNKIENPVELIGIIKKAEERWTGITLSAAKEGLLRDLMNDYFSEDE